MLRQRSNAFNSAVNMSMTSLHSYFYQADVADDISNSMFVDQASVDDVNLSMIGAAGHKTSGKKSPLKPSPKGKTGAPPKNLKTKIIAAAAKSKPMST